MTDRKKNDRSSQPTIPSWLITAVVVVVMLMWGASIVYSTVNSEWPIPTSVHAAVVAVVTGMMSYLAVKGRNSAK